MELLKKIADLFLHLGDHLDEAVSNYGVWTYALLFAIIFCETGLVVTPFLPGDSLLFAAGALAGRESLDLALLIVLLTIAAIAGDAVNYAIGKFIGPKALDRDGRFIKRKYLDRTHRFYERHGGKTIILARFVPIVRTFAPFLAGVGTMSYRKFASYNVIGAILWVCSMVLAGYFFGALPVVKENFELVVVAIIAISLLPVVYESWRAYRHPEIVTTELDEGGE